MIGARELVYSLYGAYRLCRFDALGMSYFNATHVGFWRSFFSAVLAAPVQAALVALGIATSRIQIRASIGRILLLEALSYLVLVFAYPLVVYYVSELLDRRSRYIPYIVAYNWTGALLAPLALPAALLAAGDIAPQALTNVISLAFYVVTMAIGWFVAKTGLQISGIMAVALVVLDIVINLVVVTIIDARLLVG